MPAELAPSGAPAGVAPDTPADPAAAAVAAVASLFQSAGQGNLLLDLQGTVVFVGGEAERLLGIIPGHAQHANLLSTVPDAVQIPLADALNGLRQGRTVAPFEVRWLADGRPVELLLHVTAMAEDGQTLGFVVQVFESAARRAVDAALRGDFTAAVSAAERSPFAVMLLDPRGRCAHLSPRWGSLTGQSDADTLGIGWLTMVEEQHLEPFREAATAAHRTRAGWRTSFAVQALGGRRQWMDVAAAPCIDPDGNLQAYVVVLAPAPNHEPATEPTVVAPPQAVDAPAPVDTVEAPAAELAPSEAATPGAVGPEAVGPEAVGPEAVVSEATVDEPTATEPVAPAADALEVAAHTEPAPTAEPPIVSATVLAATATVFVGSAEPAPTVDAEPVPAPVADAPAAEASEPHDPIAAFTAPEAPIVSSGRATGAFPPPAARPAEDRAPEALVIPEFTVPDSFDAVELTASIPNAPVEPAAIWTPTIQQDLHVDVDRLLGATKVESPVPELDTMDLDSAVVDKVTGLPNRLLFAKTVSETTERKDAEGLNLSVAFIDLHGLRDQQARVGARAASDYLFLIAKRLEATIRSIETAGRVDSHVLGVLSINWLFAEDLPILAQRLLNKLQEPLATRDGGEVRIAMNLGLAVIRSIEDVNSVFARAGAALARARVGGAGAFDIDYGV